MKTQKKIFLVAVMVLLTTITFGQQHQQQRKPPSIEERVKHVITVLEKKIDLSDSQKSTIENAFTDFFTKAENERKSGEHPEKSVMEGFEKERDQKIKLVLNEEQYEDYLRISCQLRPQPRRKPMKSQEGIGSNR